MNAFEELISMFLLIIIPEPIFWVFILLGIFALSLALARMPGTVAAQFSFILIWILNEYIGGPMNLLHMLMLVGLGVSIVLALYKLGNR